MGVDKKCAWASQSRHSVRLLAKKSRVRHEYHCLFSCQVVDVDLITQGDSCYSKEVGLWLIVAVP